MAKAAAQGDTIQALLKEDRKFPPPPGFKKRALVQSEAVYRDAARNPVRFWEQRAKELAWFKPWKKAL
jgi:acetyl-CoA synthetase